MQLTGKQIVENNIVYNYDEINEVQQQGVYVRIESINFVSSRGFIPKEGKTKLPQYNAVHEADAVTSYVLNPGYYEVTFMEGCNIPNNCILYFKTRSSLVRCGAIVHSGQFDAGFKSKKMGAFLHVILPIEIEKGARIAQAIVTESYTVNDENLYNGQWQNDKQRQ